jgi:hypothetical protein
VDLNKSMANLRITLHKAKLTASPLLSVQEKGAGNVSQPAAPEEEEDVEGVGRASESMMGLLRDALLLIPVPRAKDKQGEVSTIENKEEHSLLLGCASSSSLPGNWRN